MAVHALDAGNPDWTRSPGCEINAIGVGSARSLPEESKTRQAFETLQGAFGAGEATPTVILVRSANGNGAFDPDTLAGVYRLVTTLRQDPRVARVDSLVTVAEGVVPNISEAQFRAITRQQYEADPRAGRILPSLINTARGADTHAILVISREDELNADSIELVKDLRASIIPSVPQLNAVSFDNRCPSTEPTVCSGVYVTGDTALKLDYRDELLNQFPQLVAIVLVLTYVILLLFFHSLILPLKAILMNVASILASYGVLVLVFQHGFGENLLNFEHESRLFHVFTSDPVLDSLRSEYRL